jgi:starch synthase
MRILMVSSEVETFARSGGLGDVVLGLSRALARLGHEVCIVTPLYGTTPLTRPHQYWHGSIPVRVGWGPHDVRQAGVCEMSEFDGRLRFCLLANDYLFGSRKGIYGDSNGTFGDNEVRFAALSRGALEIGARLWPDGFDVLHAHDWHAALAVIYARTTMGDHWARMPSVFTIHNLAYQGTLGFEALDRLGVPRALMSWRALEHESNVNLMKGAIALSDLVTTVSPTYAREIKRTSDGFGLDWFLRAHDDKLVGIVNGIDQERFDPAHDHRIAARYDEHSVGPGKWANKRALLGEMGLAESDAPLFGCVTRLTDQKGIDLLLETLPSVIERGANVVMVGTGDRRLEEGLRRAAARFPQNVSSRIAFDSSLAQRVYAGCDFMVVPSRFEPCGLTQLYAMRYGTVPVVTDVGGLHDTVEPANTARGEGTGFVAVRPSVFDLLVAMQDAVDAYADRSAFHELRVRCMRRDSSWEKIAHQYVRDIYGRVTGRTSS